MDDEYIPFERRLHNWRGATRLSENEVNRLKESVRKIQERRQAPEAADGEKK